MTELAHEVRASLIGKERAYHLGADALHWQQDGAEGHVAYAAIDRIRLISYPSLGSLQGQCTLRDRSGAKLKIRSHHYRSLGSFEDRSATYAPFVRELCRRAASASPGAKFLVGSSGMWVVWLTLLVATVVILVLIVAALLGGASLSGGAIGALAVLALLAPAMWRMVRRGKQREFDPASPPAELLGG